MNPAVLEKKSIETEGLKKNRNYFIQTFGCQMNYSDSERTDSLLEKIGYNEAEKIENADLVIFNTCSIRQKAEDKVFGMINNLSKLRKHRPGLKIGVTGCMARIPSTQESEERDDILKRISELDFIFPIKDLPELPKLLTEIDEEIVDFKGHESSVDNYFAINPKNVTGFQRFLPIMSGCDKFCTYCIVPYSRGREWSRPMAEVLEEAEKMVDEGAIEITVVGQNVNSYGITIADKKKSALIEAGKIQGEAFDYSNMDEEPPFVQLLRKIDKLKEKGLKRLRFTSSNPWNFSEALVYAIRDLETLMPYVHLPLQSGNDAMLTRMNRSHTKEHYLEIVNLLRKEVPGCVLTTDLIVGFSGETEEEFMDTYNLFKEVEWDMAYIAQYSERRGTVASKILEDDIPREIKRKRWHMVNDLMREISREKNKKYIGEVLEVLVEKNENGVNKGRSAEYKEVYINSRRDLTGEIVPVKIKRSKEWILEGIPC